MPVMVFYTREVNADFCATRSALGTRETRQVKKRKDGGKVGQGIHLSPVYVYQRVFRKVT